MRTICLVLLLLLLPSLAACGSASEAPPAVVNYTLPDVSSFNESYSTELETQQAEASAASAQEYRWNPHGVFTITVGDDGNWAAGFVNISSVDISTHTAIVTYSIKDNRGFNLAQSEGKNPSEADYFLDSNGQLVTGVDETEDPDGTRHVIIYLPADHWLEFSGKERLTSAQYHFNGLYYGMKREG